MSLTVVILAAGQGTRMRSQLPKVLHKVGGKPMLGHVIDTAYALSADKVVVVYGHGGEQLREAFAGENIEWAQQAEQLGTGHAVQQALPYCDTDKVLVLYADVPLVRPETCAELVTALDSDDLAVLSVELSDPTGYGRIVREGDALAGIVEHKDTNAGQLTINEVNTGLMALNGRKLKGWLSELSNDNAQGEYYLTDLVEISRANGDSATAVVCPDPAEVAGANNRIQLAEAERVLQTRLAESLMVQGVTLADPARIDIRGELSVGQDIEIDVNCVFEGDVTLADGVSIGANCVIKDSRIGKGAVIKPFSHVDGAYIGAKADIGPYARLREGTQLAPEAKIGNFVETKKANIGVGSKVNHLSYVGDAEVGEGVNIGAGTITCNYDGANKHKTIIGDGAFIGSGSNLVAPVSIGKNATIGAGTTLRKDAPDEQLTLTRGKQQSVSWERPKKS
ncbi:MAG: bifunctional UDP-N-acetylglucosamine diphosphorylase/glucosamine-1-phosphate N-acetyltransferase GlmU [Gammaproteobacteria bacterium]|nr:bifunctional UDP-N-acetylglucosamine diphosphorylase/glucosamine-1-phosphate N-acetyltransferase GlmU [Gammaproteobacteria bacterium]